MGAIIKTRRSPLADSARVRDQPHAARRHIFTMAMIRLAITQITMITCIQIQSGDTAPSLVSMDA
jgi:hypothetical protein